MKPFDNIDFNKFKALNAIEWSEAGPFVIQWLMKRYKISVVIPESEAWKDKWVITNTSGDKLMIILNNGVYHHKAIIDRMYAPAYAVADIGLNITDMTVWIPMERFNFPKPEVVTSEIIAGRRLMDDDGDIFYVYTWQIQLSDGTSILVTNQNQSPHDLMRFIIPWTVQQREFLKLIKPL